MEKLLKKESTFRFSVVILDGLSVMEYKKSNVIKRAFGYYLFVVIFLFNLTQYINLGVNITNYKEVSNSLSAAALITTEIVATIAMMKYKKKIFEVLFKVTSDMEVLQSTTDEEEMEILRDFFKKNRIYKYALFSFAFCEIFVFLPYYTSQYSVYFVRMDDEIVQPVLVSLWMPFENPIYSNSVVYGLIVFASLYISFFHSSAYYLNAGLLLFLRYSLKILNIRISNMEKKALAEYERLGIDARMDISDVDKKNILQRIRYGKIVDCVRYHQDLFRVAADLNYIYEGINVAQMVTFSLILCCTIFTIVLTEFGIDLMVLIAFTSIMNSTLVVLVWNYNEIALESMAIAEAVYNAEWYNYNKRNTQALMIVASRAQQPILFKAVCYFMTLETMIMVYQIAYKSLSLLLNIDH